MEETLINELVQGMELTKQLKNHLDPLASSPESCDFLIQKILSSYDKALSMLNLGDLVGELHQVADIWGPTSQSSPRSDNFDQCPRDVNKKRKTMPRWTEQVSVCSETGLVTADDGYNWRKYGQKDILGANFPRAYYRCTHRGTQGCLATKQVQRSDTNHSIFEITYRGRHTCIQTSQEIPAFASTGKEIPNQNKGHHHLGDGRKRKAHELELLSNNETGVGVKTEETGEIFPSFSFPCTPIEPENGETIIFPDSLKENNVFGIDAQEFLSPECSESNFFSLLCPLEDFGYIENLQNSDSDITEMASAPTSVTNSPIGNLDFSLDQVDFDPNFLFDTSEFFSEMQRDSHIDPSYH